MFGKILVANRGEIACRVIRTARCLGVATVAVYSEVDRYARHVELADEAFCLGGALARESYLNSERIIDIALRAGAEAVHPGYGFLSENAAFCRASEAAGLVFIGPSAQAIELMGEKSEAKRRAAEAGVPVIPGYHGADQSDAVLLREARSLGYPILIKAAAGGGGKGMRSVERESDFYTALASARREASSSFADDRVLLEKLLLQPRHIEVQVFFDHFGSGVYLYERDCSAQRRHQKLMEEAPAPGVDDSLRQAMGQAALSVARAVKYRGAGTVEFLLDAGSGQFYFMEMNTRLQVEHPVTEMICGEDLVEWQLRVAAGETLPKRQHQLVRSGHAIEVRICAEDPHLDFLPSTGALWYLSMPETSDTLRIDSGVRQDDVVTPYYDSMIAKLIVRGNTRQQALQQLGWALLRCRIAGVTTNIGLLSALVGSPGAVQGSIHTRYVEDHLAVLLRDESKTGVDRNALAGLYLALKTRYTAIESNPAEDPFSPWGSGDAWRIGESGRYRFEVEWPDGRENIEVEVADQTLQAFNVRSSDQVVCLKGGIAADGVSLWVDVEGCLIDVGVADNGKEVYLFTENGNLHFLRAEPRWQHEEQHAGFGAPMNGTIVTLLVEPDVPVAAGESLLVMEAMKMEHALRAPVAGRVLRYLCKAGDMVDAGQVLLEFTPSDGSDAATQ